MTSFIVLLSSCTVFSSNFILTSWIRPFQTSEKVTVNHVFIYSFDCLFVSNLNIVFDAKSTWIFMAVCPIRHMRQTQTLFADNLPSCRMWYNGLVLVLK